MVAPSLSEAGAEKKFTNGTIVMVPTSTERWRESASKFHHHWSCVLQDVLLEFLGNNMNKICRALVSFSVISSATAAFSQTSNTLFLNYSFYGPAGRYLIELFEVGNPFPSRQDWDLKNSRYNGVSTYRRNWDYISKGRDYFIRVTNTDTGVRKQSYQFRVPASWGDYFNAPHFNWYA